MNEQDKCTPVEDVQRKVKINMDLAKKQNMTELEIACFELLSTRLQAILKRPTMYANPDEVVDIVKGYEYVLQDLLHFEYSADKHNYWKELADCSCLKMDNDFLWGTGLRYINSNCKWHRGDK